MPMSFFFCLYSSDFTISANRKYAATLKLLHPEDNSLAIFPDGRMLRKRRLRLLRKEIR